ncbi:MAG: DUF6231 family protein [Guyparkeria sp.]|uniref:DUF6231 family protein n=1 Tax=Guyparkeria sp. TaxID=2035736 RepID=UPI003979FA03
MNAKKTASPRVLVLDHQARDGLDEPDNRLIACEELRPGAARITILVGDEIVSEHDNGGRELVEPAMAGNELPDGDVVDVVIDVDEWAPILSQLLASLRDRGNRPVIVYLHESVDDRMKMIALGYKASSPDDPVYQFDIHDYKQTPDWLNPRNWANPELWDKYRW